MFPCPSRRRFRARGGGDGGARRARRRNAMTAALHIADRPPSSLISAAGMKLLSFEARSTTALATSSTSPSRPRGACRLSFSITVASSRFRRDPRIVDRHGQSPEQRPGALDRLDPVGFERHVLTPCEGDLRPHGPVDAFGGLRGAVEVQVGQQELVRLPERAPARSPRRCPAPRRLSGPSARDAPAHRRTAGAGQRPPPAQDSASSRESCPPSPPVREGLLF